MATITEPKTDEVVEPSPQLTTQPEPELFAAEIAMENKSSNFFPLLFIAALVLVVGGTIYYFVKGAKDVLTVPAATASVTQLLKAQAPPMVHFSTGTVVQNVNEKPLDPHYKLLAKSGIILTKPKGPTSLIVTMTPAGETVLGNIKGVQKVKSSDGNAGYAVPLAERKLVSIDKVSMIKPHLAKVEYTWKWEPNRLGHEFDASGSLVKSFVMWDRATLIKSYGVDFYTAEPTKASIVLMEGNEGVWKPYAE